MATVIAEQLHRWYESAEQRQIKGTDTDIILIPVRLGAEGATVHHGKLRRLWFLTTPNSQARVEIGTTTRLQRDREPT